MTFLSLSVSVSFFLFLFFLFFFFLLFFSFSIRFSDPFRNRWKSLFAQAVFLISCRERTSSISCRYDFTWWWWIKNLLCCERPLRSLFLVSNDSRYLLDWAVRASRILSGFLLHVCVFFPFRSFLSLFLFFPLLFSSSSDCPYISLPMNFAVNYGIGIRLHEFCLEFSSRSIFRPIHSLAHTVASFWRLFCDLGVLFLPEIFYPSAST